MVAPPKPNVLSASGATVRYGNVVALDTVHLDVTLGECVALVGESGAGKTTLLRCFNGLTALSGGTAWVRDRGVTPEHAVELRRTIGYVPQDGGLLPHWTVRRNVGLVPWLRDLVDRESMVDRALDQVGLPGAQFGDRYPKELSGGQRQRVAIARALAARPDTVLLDEPFGALDAITRTELRRVFKQLRGEVGFSALLVTHDLHEAFELADRVAVMKDGRIDQCASPADLRASPATDYVQDLLSRAGVV